MARFHDIIKDKLPGGHHIDSSDGLSYILG
jgi:hypothetical protein